MTSEEEFRKKIEEENLRRERENAREANEKASLEADAKFVEIEQRRRNQ
jgi:hypothetical protein